METKTRERILEAAASLFYTQGYRVVGVDKIIADSGMAKMTFYKHFPSKDDLIAAYLQNTTEGFWRWMGSCSNTQTPKRVCSPCLLPLKSSLRVQLARAVLLPMPQVNSRITTTPLMRLQKPINNVC
jgi:AcrR family transcriptional regulator